MKSWMLPPIDGSDSMVVWSMLVPEPILVALKTSEPPLMPTTCTLSSVVTLLLSWALTVLI